MDNLKNIVFPILLVFSLLTIAASEEEDLLFINYHIHITSDLPSDLPPGVAPLRLHCKSGDKDLGERMMHEHDDYTWDTKINLWRTTRFFCNAWWEGKTRSFDAFRALRDEHRCRRYHNSCLWSVREDGIYFSNDGSNWFNEYPW